MAPVTTAPDEPDGLRVAEVLRRYAASAAGDDRTCLLYAANHFAPVETLAPRDPNATLPPAVAAVTDSGVMPSGYELLGELGRGGMGVVYKARQLGLNRVVALKTILAAGHAGPAQLARFQAEAEAVAKLKHPNIVQVHDIGERDGLPYFALEYVDGGSLASQLDGTPWDGPRAAVLVETLARAVHAAHEAGIVHRDLKPGNVLLAADGTPKVADFGLAKHMEVEGATRTGEVMGTPEYMAPEQAAGRKDRGPTADVYALGVILYELLVGRPPLRGATPLDTLLMVLEQEPVTVRRLNPRAGRDLETVCWKCLHKEPALRYRSARELADDLQRVAAGEPVAAKPPSTTRRVFEQLKRMSSAALLGGVISALGVVALGVAAPMTRGASLAIAVSVILAVIAVVRTRVVPAAVGLLLSAGLAVGVELASGPVFYWPNDASFVAFVGLALGYCWNRAWPARLSFVAAAVLATGCIVLAVQADVPNALWGVFGGVTLGLFLGTLGRLVAWWTRGSSYGAVAGAIGGALAGAIASSVLEMTMGSTDVLHKILSTVTQIGTCAGGAYLGSLPRKRPRL